MIFPKAGGRTPYERAPTTARKVIFCAAILCILVAYPVFHGLVRKNPDGPAPSANGPSLKPIHGKVGKGETFSDIFKKHGLNMEELLAMKNAAAMVHRLRDIHSGRQYVITIDDDNCVDSVVYWIDDDSLLRIEKADRGFQATKCKIPYESRIITKAGAIEDNLISAVGDSREETLLALKVSDIFAWDIDFASDLRRGDTFTVVVQALYSGDSFAKYGEVLSAEFVNEGRRYRAYRFSWDGKADYYDEAGRSLKRAFLKAPLSFRRISSTFSGRRFHPVLKTYRPHRGVDYAAAAGAPVNSTGDGVVSFAGRRGGYGNLVVLRHRNGFTTCYGHLSRIEKGIHRGAKIGQGDVVGYVGATGIATGPHLHYEMRQGRRHINPLTVKLAGNPVPAGQMARFRKVITAMDRAAGTRKETAESAGGGEKGQRSPGKGG